MIFADDDSFYEILESLRNEFVLLGFLHGGKDFERYLNLLLKIQQEYRYAFNIVIVNKAESEKVARAYDIIGTPTLIILRQGSEKNRILGSFDIDDLREILKKPPIPQQEQELEINNK